MDAGGQGWGVELAGCPRNTSARTKGAESLPSALGQPPSPSSLAPWLPFRDPGSGASVAPRHSGDAARAACGCLGNLAQALVRGARLPAQSSLPAPRVEIGLGTLRKTPVASGEEGGIAARAGFFYFYFRCN